MCGYADAVAVGIPQDLAEGDEGLDITSGAYNLNNNVEFRRWCLAWLATEAGWYVRWGEGPLRCGVVSLAERGG